MARVSIRISTRTRRSLDRLRRPDETFDDLLNKLAELAPTAATRK